MTFGCWPRARHREYYKGENESLEILEIGTPATLEAHNVLCKPSIEVRSKAKLYPSSRAFQRYVARHLNTRKLG